MKWTCKQNTAQISTRMQFSSVEGVFHPSSPRSMSFVPEKNQGYVCAFSLDRVFQNILGTIESDEGWFPLCVQPTRCGDGA